MSASASPEIVTAAVLVIGDEILSGRTKDRNIGFIAEYLTNLGIELKEVRVVPDEEEEIVAAVNALRQRYAYLFTTGGIGPTHDDITADAVAKAFGVGISVHPEARALLAARFKGDELNEARLRMARIPHGGELVLNPVSQAPGIRIDNVFVMAGVPSIMQAMMDNIAPLLKTGRKMLSATIRADLKEGDIGTALGLVARAHPEAMIGSYPFWDENQRPNTNLVIRARDAGVLEAARLAVVAMLTEERRKIAGPETDPAKLA